LTTRRYTNYRRALSLIDSIDRGGLPAGAAGLLRDHAEGMLLSRAAELGDLEQESDSVALLLTKLVATDAVGVETATELWRTIVGAGPGGVAPAATHLSLRAA
jgi:hypothetical protein